CDVPSHRCTLLRAWLTGRPSSWPCVPRLSHLHSAPTATSGPCPRPAPPRRSAFRHARRKGTTRSNQKQELPTTGQTPKAHGIGRGLLVARVDWESERRLRAADFALDGGPPIWIVLDRVYEALSEAVAGSKRDAALTGKAFGSF